VSDVACGLRVDTPASSNLRCPLWPTLVLDYHSTGAEAGLLGVYAAVLILVGLINMVTLRALGMVGEISSEPIRIKL
jgi:hypothetical protein